MPAKRGGTLSLSNKRFIGKNFDKMTVAEMARETKKPAALIENYIRLELDSEPLGDTINTSPSQTVDQSVNLRARPYWLKLQEHYSTAELNIFEEKYHAYMAQFKYDVQATEEQQIFHMIGLEIEIDRNKAARKRNMDLRERRLKDINAAEKDDDRTKVHSFQQDIISLDSATSDLMRELKDLLDRHNKLAETLKGTRDQRLKEATSGKISWLEVLKYWADPKNREWEAKKLATVNAAVEQERSRMYSYHTYMDGKVDQPVLNTEAINAKKE